MPGMNNPEYSVNFTAKKQSTVFFLTNWVTFTGRRNGDGE
jgi:hypothetical protein